MAERRTWIVVALTGSMMIVELAAGWLFNSMAVFADGWHMSTHAAALSLTGFAYWYARRLKADRRFAFGPWKIEPLGGFTSAILLAIVALYMAWESGRRLVSSAHHPLRPGYGGCRRRAGREPGQRPDPERLTAADTITGTRT